MRNRIAAVLGGVGLFAALLGFVATTLAPGEDAGGAWGLVMALGLVAFLWSVLGGAGRPDSS